MGDVYQGTQMRIKMGTKTLFHEQNAELQSSIDFKEVASKDTAGKIKTPGTQDWSLNATTLIAMGNGTTQEDVQTLYAAHKNKTLINVTFGNAAIGDVTFSGSAYISTFNIKAQNEEAVTGDFTFAGSGELLAAINA